MTRTSWSHSRAPDPADERAEALLTRHLTEEQREEYARDGVVTVVTRGWLVGVVLRQAALAALAMTAAVLLPLALAPALVLLVMLPILTPSFLIGCLRRRVWRIDPDRGPRLVMRRFQVEFCVGFLDMLPAADRILAFKNVLQANEGLFLRKANVERFRRLHTAP